MHTMIHCAKTSVSLEESMHSFLLRHLLFTVRSILADANPQGIDSPKAEQSLPVSVKDKYTRSVNINAQMCCELVITIPVYLCGIHTKHYYCMVTAGTIT